VSHSVQRDSISNLCNPKWVVWWNPHTDRGKRACKHDSFAFVSMLKNIGHWTLDIGHHCIHHKCLILVSYGIKKAKIRNLCNSEWVACGTLILIIAGEPPCMIHLHLYLYMRTLDIMVPTIIVSSLSGIVKISNLCNLERVVWWNPHTDHSWRACKHD
jgi:hypothetical protein